MLRLWNLLTYYLPVSRSENRGLPNGKKPLIFSMEIETLKKRPDFGWLFIGHGFRL